MGKNHPQKLTGDSSFFQTIHRFGISDVAPIGNDSGFSKSNYEFFPSNRVPTVSNCRIYLRIEDVQEKNLAHGGRTRE